MQHADNLIYALVLFLYMLRCEIKLLLLFVDLFVCLLKLILFIRLFIYLIFIYLEGTY